MTRRITILVAIALLCVAPAAHAGGMAPGIPGPKVKISGPTINGVMVVDTHPDASTIVTSADFANLVPPPFPPPTTEHKAKLASLWLQRGGLTAGAIIRLPAAFAAFLGCVLATNTQPDVTSARFGFDPSKFDNNGLRNWMPSATVDALLTGLGLNPATAGDPVIVSIGSAVCTADPENPAPASGIPGILSFEFNIQFVQP